MNVRAKLNDDIFKFYLPLRKPKVSASGKSIVIASTTGLARTGVEYEGQEVFVSANAFIQNPEHQPQGIQREKKQSEGKAGKPK